MLRKCYTNSLLINGESAQINNYEVIRTKSVD